MWLSLGGFQEAVPPEAVPSVRQHHGHGDDRRLPESLKESGQSQSSQRYALLTSCAVKGSASSSGEVSWPLVSSEMVAKGVDESSLERPRVNGLAGKASKKWTQQANRVAHN